MKNDQSGETFGDTLSAIIADRGIKSDELLARKAMRAQAHQASRINVQRKTINNWRNNRSMPRSVTDRQFQLVLSALEVNERELANLIRFFDTDPKSQQDGPVDTATAPTNQSKWIALATLGSVIAIAILLSIIWVSMKPSRDYLATIPSSELSLTKDGFILPDSDKKPITNQHLEKLTGWELYIARNEIFARKGWKFTRASSICLQRHFDQFAKTATNPMGWYEVKPQKGQPSNLEFSNAEVIRSFECNVRGGQFKCNGHLNQCE